MSGSGDFSIGSTVWPGTSKVLEELGELQQVLGKLIATAGAEQHWDGSNLRDRIVEEIGDVVAALTLFETLNMTDDECRRVGDRALLKVATFQAWHERQMKREVPA